MFALSNGHIGLRGNLDEGEPYGLPGTYLNGFYETRPLPYAEAGYGYPEDGADRRQRHQRQADPPAGRRRALRHVRYGELLEHEALLDLRAGMLRASLRWRSPTGRTRAGHLRRASSRSCSARSPAIRYEVEPIDGAGPGGRPVGAGRQRAACPAIARDPRAAAALAAPLGARGARGRGRRARRARPPTQAVEAADGRRRMDHVDRGARTIAPASRPRPRPTWAGVTITAELQARASRCGCTKFVAYGWSARALAARAARSGGARRWPSARHAGWDELCARAARVPRRLLGAAPTSSSTATPSSSRRSASRSSTRCRPAPAREAAGDPGQGPDRPRLRRPRLLGHRGLRAAGAHLHARRRPPPRRCAGGTATLPLAARTRAGQLGLRRRGLPVADDPRRRVLGYWPAGTAAFHVNADIADAVDPLRRRRPATEEFERDDRPASCWWRRRGCGARWATTTPRAPSASTASPAPTSTAAVADNNVYTEPDGAAEPAGGRGASPSATPAPPTPSSVDDEEIAGLARRRRGDDDPLRRGSSACTRRPRASPRHQRWDFEGTGAGPVPAAAALPVLRPLPQAGGQAGRPGAGPALAAATPSRAEQKARNFAYYERLTVRDSSLSRVRAGGDGGGGRPPRPRLRLLRRGRPRWTSTTSSTTPATACTSPRWPARGRLPRSRLRRHARPGRRAPLRPAPAAAARPAVLPPSLPRSPAHGRGHRVRDEVLLLRANRCASITSTKRSN